MILSRPDIVRYIEERKLRFEPAVPLDRVAQVSVDLLPRHLPAIHVDPSLWSSADIWEHSEAESFRLEPRHFVLAQTLERVLIPNDLVGLIEGRSSFARVGVTIHVTAPKIDPGFDGHITLEMANFGAIAVDLRAGVDKPAQLMLLKVSTPLETTELYGTGEGDTFQYQTEPVPRKKR